MPCELTTAPPNPAPQWPAGYIAALREAGAPERTIQRFRGIALAPRPDVAAAHVVVTPAASPPG